VLIGLDFDNTLVDYGAVFRHEAAEMGLAVSGEDKTDIRDTLRSRPDGELLWQRLQARVYGPGLMHARAMPGALEFLASCRERGIELAIVSHKTRYAAQDPGGVDLREAASAWLRRQEIAIPSGHTFFEGTRSEKLSRIAGLGCTHFVDDLLEVLVDPAFPASTSRLWLTTESRPTPPSIELAGDWFQIARHVLR
jgi:hypothetical protein